MHTLALARSRIGENVRGRTHTHTHTQNQTPTYMHAMTDWDESHRPLFKCINYIIIR